MGTANVMMRTCTGVKLNATGKGMTPGHRACREVIRRGVADWNASWLCSVVRQLLLRGGTAGGRFRSWNRLPGDGSVDLEEAVITGRSREEACGSRVLRKMGG